MIKAVLESASKIDPALQAFLEQQNKFSTGQNKIMACQE
jgi:hypothetical protein